ncbi:MAG: hypothetical protein NWF06_08235 [Candidatus Bathyarchaeota archaeon]|nr:hypothetical protein [Candidatus Bathyarchaeum sp.]
MLHIKSSETSAILILLTGVALLVITFFVSYIHLHGEINVLPVPSLFASFGDSLSPLIEAAIRALYLGVMGWIASTITAKGTTLLLHSKLQDKHALCSLE